MSSHRLHPNILILITFLTHVLYLSSLTLRDYVLLLYCFADFCKLVLRLGYFAYLYLMGSGCHLQFFDILVYLIQTVLSYTHLSMSYTD